MHGLRRRLSEPRMAGQLPADRSANQRVTAAGDSFLCMRMCDIKHTYKQSKKRVKTEPVENSRSAGFYVLSWFLRQKLASFCRETLFCCTGARFSRRNGDWFGLTTVARYLRWRQSSS